MHNLRPIAAALASVVLSIGIAASPSRAGISAVNCGDPDASDSITANDALTVLRASVGLGSCDDCICNVNGDAAVTAIDALIVLHVSVGIDTTFACDACPNVRFRIASTTTCVATHVTIPAAALPNGLTAEDCAVASGAAAPPCNATYENGDQGLVIDIRHGDESPFETCVLSGTLFSCGVTQEEAAKMIAAATVSCPCNCLPTCPSFGLCDEASDGCVVAPTAAATDSATTNPSVEGVGGDSASSRTTVRSSTTSPLQSTTTSTTFCGTCCNMEELGQVEVVEAPPVLTEILMRVNGETTEHGCLFCGPEIFQSGRNVYIEHEDEDSALICIIDHHGIAEPGEVAICEGYGNLAFGPAEVLRASGINFEPLAALPAVNLNAP